MNKKLSDKLIDEISATLSDEISATLSDFLEFEKVLSEYHPRTIAAYQVEIFSDEDFIKTSEGLTNMGNDFSDHFKNAFTKYSFLGFGKEFIRNDSPLNKRLQKIHPPVVSKDWASIEELSAAIEKIKSTKMVEFDEDILTETCIFHLRFKFLKKIFPGFFEKCSNFLKQSTNRMNTLKSKSTFTMDTILRDYLEASLKNSSSNATNGHLINPLTAKSPLRKMLSPKKIGIYTLEIIHLLEIQIDNNIKATIALKDNAKKQRVYMSAIDLIQILKPHFMENYEEIQESPKYKDKDITFTKTLYFKKYAKKRILETGLFVQQ
jgi:hypothetical protein